MFTHISLSFHSSIHFNIHIGFRLSIHRSLYEKIRKIYSLGPSVRWAMVTLIRVELLGPMTQKSSAYPSYRPTHRLVASSKCMIQKCYSLEVFKIGMFRTNCETCNTFATVSWLLWVPEGKNYSGTYSFGVWFI